MKTDVVKVTAGVTALSAILFVLHYYLVEEPGISIWKIYLFMGVATILTVICLKWIQSHVMDKLGIGFLVLVSIKFGAILLIFPELFREEQPLDRSQMIGFVLPYMIYIFIEVGIVLKWLNKK